MRVAASVPLRSRLLWQRRGVPDRDHAVRRAAGQELAVRAKSHAPDVRFEGEELLAGLRIPHLDRLVARSAGQAFAVGAEGHARDSASVSLGGEEFLAGLRIPHLYLARLKGGPYASTGRGEALAVRANSHAIDFA